MKIRIIQGIVHAAGDLEKGSVHTVGDHPSKELAEWLLKSGRAAAVSEDTKTTAKPAKPGKPAASED